MRAAHVRISVLGLGLLVGCGDGSRSTTPPASDAAQEGGAGGGTGGGAGGRAAGAGGSAGAGGNAGAGGSAGARGNPGGSGGSAGTPGGGGSAGAGGSAGSANDGGADAIGPDGRGPADAAPAGGGASGALAATCNALSDAATKLLAALSPRDRQAALRPFGESRTKWNFLPPSSVPREGLAVGALPAEARNLAEAFVKTALSERGYLKASIIRDIEAATQRGAYFLTLFGMPSAVEPWGFRLEGHHLSLNFTIVKCVAIATTPAFLGANPAAGLPGGMRPLGAEEDLARELFVGLPAAQQAKARVETPAMTTPATARVNPRQPAGLLAGEMAPADADRLRKLLGEYLGNMTPTLAAVRLAEIETAGFTKIGFAFAGSTRKGEAHYYRVQGPTFLIEYDNNNGNHIHSVWRDFDGDFGADVLKMHYQLFPHP